MKAKLALNQCRLAVLLTALLLPATASAAAVFSCADVKDLNSRAESCEDNEAYSEAAVECMSRFFKMVQDKTKSTAKKLDASNKKHVADSVNKQTNTFQGSGADYQISIDTFNELIRVGNFAKAQVKSYQPNVVYPDEWDVAEDLGMDIVQFMDNNPCYADARDVIKNVIEDIDRAIKDLEKSKAASAALKSASGSRESTMKGGAPGSGAVIKGGKAPPTPATSALKGGKQQHRESDVSGIEESKKKNVKLK